MNFFERLQLNMAKRQLRGRRAEFYFDLAMSLEDRVPLFSTFKKYEQRARKRDRSMALLYRHILKNAINGSLATALEGVAPASELMMLDAAQTAGDASVAEGLRFLSGTVEKTERMTAAIKGAVMYPLFLIVLFYAILLGFSFYAIPVLEGLMPVNEWPASGKALAFVANGVRNYGLIIIAVNVVLFISFLYSLPNWAGRSRRPFDRRLPYSVYRDYSGAMLIVSLASLMRSGISLRSSLEQAVRYSTPWMRWHLRAILKGISSTNADNFGAAFATGVLNQDLEDRIMDASERRDPVEAFVKIGTGSIDRIASSIEKSSSRLNSVMLLVCGMALASMLLGFMATTQQLQSAVQKKTQQTSQRK